MYKIVLVGSGPTSLYTLAALLAQPEGLSITVLERESQSGTGMPFRPDDTDAILLANIASIEVPPICTTLLDWVRGLPRDVLQHLGIGDGDLHDRRFFPRILLGAYLRSQLAQLAKGAAARGHEVRILNNAEAVDVARLAKGYRVTTMQGKQILSMPADTVVLATGHIWTEDAPDIGYYASPWPSAKLHDIPATEVGVLGSSLSGIDAALTIASQHGRFSEAGARYDLADDAGDLKITLMSRKGLLPEADFWCELPYLPLEHCTPEAVSALSSKDTPCTVDEIFDLIRTEISAADPNFAKKIGLAKMAPDDFADAYFRPRLGKDQIALAAANLAEVEQNAAERRTVQWRYAILRLHEAVAPLVPFLSDAERKRFQSAIAPVFVDNYAAVPPQTIRRLLALAQSGCLEVVAVGDATQIKTDEKRRKTEVSFGTESLTFTHFVDARGQASLPLGELPFPTLLDQIDGDDDAPIVLDDSLHVVGGHGTFDGLYCAALPFILDRFPFAQGITVSHDLGELVARSIARERKVAPEPDLAMAS